MNEKYQKTSGTIERRAFSEAIHCMMKRMENISWAENPMPSQTSSSVDMLAHQRLSFAKSMCLLCHIRVRDYGLGLIGWDLGGGGGLFLVALTWTVGGARTGIGFYHVTYLLQIGDFGYCAVAALIIDYFRND